jgi:hypothetical protein
MIKALIKSMTFRLVAASDADPVRTSITIMIFYIMFNMALATLEALIWGERFEHWLDPVFVIMFMAYMAHAVFWCAAVQVTRMEKKND